MRVDADSLWCDNGNTNAHQERDKPMKTLAVFFDLGDTLIERKPEIDFDSIQYICQHSDFEPAHSSNRPLLRKHLKSAEKATWNKVSQNLLLSIRSADAEYRFMREQFYPEVLRRLGVRAGSRDLFDILARRAVVPESFQCFTDTLSTLENLRGMGVRLGIISNALPSAVDQLAHLDLERSFDCMVLSYQVGSLKPSPAIYRVALRRLEVSGQTAWYIDDRPGFVTAAQAPGIGMNGILYDHDREHVNQCARRIENISDLIPYVRGERQWSGLSEQPADMSQSDRGLSRYWSAWINISASLSNRVRSIAGLSTVV